MDCICIAKKLRDLRGDISASVVANALGISVSALFMYERGERIPRDEVKVRIAQYYGKSVQDIFYAQSST